MESSTENSISTLEGLHVIEREIISHRVNKTDNSKFMLVQKKYNPAPTVVHPTGVEPAQITRLRRAVLYPLSYGCVKDI